MAAQNSIGSRLAAFQSEKRVIAICFFIALSQFQYGFDSAAVSGFQSMPGFLKVFGYHDPHSPIGYNISTTVQTLIQSLIQLGGLLACISIFIFGDTISRRLGLWLASAFAAISLSIQISSNNKAALYIGRLLLGVSNGFYLPFSVTYMAEVAPASLRGPIVGLVTFQTSFGALIGILVDYYTSVRLTRLSYQIPVAVMYAVPLLISLGLLLLPDTPRYYVSKGRDEKAISAIRKLRGIKDERIIRDDVLVIKQAWLAETELQSTVRLQDAFSGTDLRRTLISLGCAVGQTATGIIFLASFSVYFFIQADIGSPFKWVMVSLAIALTGNLAAFPAQRIIDRRVLLVSTSILNAALMLAMGITYTVLPRGSPSAGKALVGLSIVYTWVYGIGQGPVLWSVQTEVPSQRLRSQTIGLAQGANFIFAWLAAYCTPYFINPSALNWGPKYCFVWGGSNAILGLWVLLFVPETRGRSLEQLDELFAKKVPTSKFAGYETDLKQVNMRSGSVGTDDEEGKVGVGHVEFGRDVEK